MLVKFQVGVVKAVDEVNHNLPFMLKGLDSDSGGEFIRPVMKIKLKEKINNFVCKEIYDKAQTPYQRLIS